MACLLQVRNMPSRIDGVGELPIWGSVQDLSASLCWRFLGAGLKNYFEMLAWKTYIVRKCAYGFLLTLGRVLAEEGRYR